VRDHAATAGFAARRSWGHVFRVQFAL
jgi:hypothetical protein